VSRYGLIACASSLDQGGPCARTVLDTALLHEVIAGHDPLDSTSIDQPVPAVVEAARRGATGDLRGLRIGVVREMGGEGYQPGVRASYDQALRQLEKLGAELVEVSCPHFEYGLAAYYLILPSEASSNLARFDAMRYGLRVDKGASAEEVMAATREAGFGPEAKRRIILGTYALSSGYYDAYYGQAQKVRTLIARDFAAAFEQVDVLVSPTTPTTAFPIGDKIDDPLAMYLNDLATIPTNLAGTAAMSVPSGLAEGLPVGLQVMAPALGEAVMYRVAAAYEAARNAAAGAPLINSVPEASTEPARSPFNTASTRTTSASEEEA
jgi:aspartyl-tRNA(Asn)/glutamyl-tRNA(Gln) amidotransferase subunit A